MRYSYTNNDGVSPVIGVILMVAITVILSGVVFVGIGGFADSTNQNASAGYSVDYASESQMTVQLNSIEQADKVEVVSSLGTRYELTEVGDTQAILNTDSGQTPVVVGTYEGKETVLGEVEPRSFTADRVVSADGSVGNYTTIQGAVDAADSGDIIVVKRNTYTTGSIIVDKSVTIIGEHGTTIADSTSDSTGTITVSANDVTISNFSVETGSYESNSVSSSGDNTTIISSTLSAGSNLQGANSTIIESTDLLNGQSSSVSGSTQTGPEPIHEWKLNSDATDSVGSLDGTTYGGITYTFSPVEGNAAQLDGTDDRINISSTELESSSSGFTVSFWANPATKDGDYENLIRQIHGMNIQQDASNNIRAVVSVSGTSYQVEIPNTSYSTSEWTLITVTYTGEKLSIYQDGSVVDSDSTMSGASDASVESAVLGARPNNNGEYFDGSLDRVQIYDTALTESEVSTLYSSQVTAEAPNTRAVTVSNNTSSELNNYEVKLTFDSGDPIFANASTDGTDIRIRGPNGFLLDHAVTKYDASAETATIWVEVPSIPASSDTELTIEYGDGENKKQSDKRSTFIAYDGFEDGDLSRWEYVEVDGGGSWGLESSNPISGSHSARISSANNEPSEFIYWKDNQNLKNVEIQMTVQSFHIDATSPGLILRGNTTGSTESYFASVSEREDASSIKQNTNVLSSGSHTLNDGDIRTFTFRISGNSLEYLIDGTTHLTATDSTITSGGTAGFRAMEGDYIIDDIRIRSYVENEPTVTIDSEQSW